MGIWWRRQAALILGNVAWLAGCSGGSGAPVTSPYSETAPVTTVAFSGSVVRAETRFLGYGKKALRASVIDPVQAREVWGMTVDGGDDGVLPLPDFEGLAFRRGRDLRIEGRDGNARSFAPMSFDLGHSAHARATATYAFVSRDGTRLKVVRYLGAGRWQDDEMSLPWTESREGPDLENPPLAVAALTGDGTKLLVWRPETGDYAVYAAANAGDALAGPVATCAGEGAQEGRFRAMVVDEGMSVLYAGDRTGHVIAIAYDTCTALASRPAMTLPAATPVTGLEVAGPGQIDATQVGSAMTRVAFDGTAFGAVIPYTGLCPYPAGAVPGGNGRLLVTCYEPHDFDPAQAKSAAAAPAVISYDRAFLMVVSTESHQAERTLAIDPTAGLAGTAVDATTHAAYFLRDSALGILDTYDLQSGGQTTVKGMFVRNILESP